MMYEYRIAYRYLNNEVQGFIGSGFTKQLAENNAFRLILKKLSIIGEQFDSSRCIVKFEGLTEKEKEIIKKDFTNN